VGLSAYAIATPLLVRIEVAGELSGTVLGSASTAAYIEAGGFVAAVTARTVPLMPNGVAVIQSHGMAAIPERAPARLTRERIEMGAVSVSLTGAEAWDPSAPRNEDGTASQVGRRGRGILRNCRIAPAPDARRLAEALARSKFPLAAGPEGEAAIGALLSALAARDPYEAGAAAEALTGRGTGLTPEGDDVLGAAAATVAAFGRAAGMSGDQVDSLTAGLCSQRARTTALSATLMELAAKGQVMEPVQHLLDLGQTPETWRPALQRLLSVGHGTGRAYALGCGAAATMLGLS
jgi:hypothetical protein